MDEGGNLDLSQFSEEERLQLEQSVSPGHADAGQTLHMISQEGLRLDAKEVAEATPSENDQVLDSSVQYVDLKIKEGEQIRLKIPLGADPLVYATQYLQAMTDSSGIEEK